VTLARLLGAATAAYGVGTLAYPRLLAKPCRLTETDGGTSWKVDVLIRALGVRDAASGLAIMLSPHGRPLQFALALRAVADAGDAATFGPVVPEGLRGKVVAAAGGWALLNLGALVLEVGRPRPGQGFATP
jgi:hypothetical protein